jgi:carboxyl-terminal processing protease
MTRVPGFLRRLALLSVAFFALSPLFAADRKPFTTSSTLQSEASTLIKLLEQAHYNHENVRSSDFASVVPDYMGDLDGQRLFFLGTDKAKFMDDYGQKIYYNLAFLGNLEAAGAYEIFYVYQQRVESRIAWIFAELKKDFDLTSKENYRADRAKAEWPANPAMADDLWRKRLKFEIVAELLNKKSIDEAKTVVRKRYERMLKNLGEIEGNDLAELFLSTVARLYDPHSTYFSAATYEDFGIQMKLQLVGIGALLGLEDDVCIVKEIVPGGPANIGGVLKPNDKIISVAQTGAEPVEIVGMKLRKIVEMIRGQKGTQVHLTVQPADATDASARREIVITRDTVKLNSARARAAIFQMPMPDGKTQPLGVITLPGFYGPADDGDTDAEKTTAAKDVARLIELLKKEGIQGLVLDLRHNGGGYLTEAIELAGLFIQQGPVVQVRSYNGDVQVDRDSNPRIAYEGPLAVLVDRFSASASEIVAGALQNYGRAIVIGDSSTHGKGSVQQVVEMKQLSRALAFSPVKTGAAKFTIQKYYLPSGASTQLKGVVPDISLPAINDYLPIGEGDLPRALVWDQIPTSSFDGSPLDPKVVAPLKQSSLERQAKLEEFAYLRKNVEWFKSRQEQKLISINLEERQKQKTEDDAFRKEMKAEKERLAKNDFAFKPYYLGPPPVPKIKAPKKDSEKTAEDDIEAETEDHDTYVKADVHLRETLRVVSDAIALGRNRELWAANRAPLTAIIKGG